MVKQAVVIDSAAAASGSVPEIRFRPAPDVYARATQIAESLGLTVTDVARMGFTQLANSHEIRLVPPGRAQALRDIPVHGATAGRIADIAAAAARAVDDEHVRAGRLEATPAAAPAGSASARR